MAKGTFHDIPNFSSDLPPLDRTEELPDPIPETPEIRAQIDAMESEVLGPEIEEMSDEELRESTEAVNEDMLEYLRMKKKSDNKEEARRARVQYELYEDTNELMEEIEELIDKDKFEKAEKLSIKFLDKIQKKLAKEGAEDDYILAAAQQLQDYLTIHGQMAENTKYKPKLWLAITSNVIDAIPFVGSTKMMAEAGFGKTMDGTHLGLKKRVFKAGEAALWGVVDVAAVALGAFTVGGGAVLVEGSAIALKGARAAKGISAASKSVKGVRRTAAVLRTAKGTSKGAKAMMNVSRFMVKHPHLVTKTDDVVRMGAQLRKFDNVRDWALVAKKGAVDVPLDWTKRTMVLRRMRKEREEYLAALDDALLSASLPKSLPS
jgi:hypothetical protein